LVRLALAVGIYAKPPPWGGCPGCSAVYYGVVPDFYHKPVGTHHSIVYATEYTRWSISSVGGHETHKTWAKAHNWDIPIKLGVGEMVRPLFMIPPIANPKNGFGVPPDAIQEAFTPIPLTRTLTISTDDATVSPIRSWWGNLFESGRALPINLPEQLTEIQKQHRPYNLEIWWRKPIYIKEHNLIYCGMTVCDETRS